MASEPKRRHSKARKRTRRAAIKLGIPAMIICKNCGKQTLTHIVCKDCGFYGGKAVAKEKVKVTKV